MRAVRLVRLGKPLEDAEIALPEIGPSEVLVRVAACGICHSDAHYRAGISPTDPLPMTLGHEVAVGWKQWVQKSITSRLATAFMCNISSPAVAAISAWAAMRNSAPKGK